MAEMMTFKSAGTVEREENEKRSVAAKAGKKDEVVVQNLSSFLDHRWETAKTSKHTAEEQFLKNLRMRRREYSPQMHSALLQMFGVDYDPVYAPVAETKSSAAESWLKEIYFQKGERPWAVDPTPMPELPAAIEKVVEFNVRVTLAMKQQLGGGGQMPSDLLMEGEVQELLPKANEEVSKVIMQMAKDSADKVSTRIEDMFIEGEWNKALSQCIYDIVTFGTMIMKGPFLEREMVRLRKLNPLTGKWEPKLEERLKEYWMRVNPFDFYPLPGVTTTQKGDFFEVLRLARMDLSDMLDVEGWDQDAVRAVLREYRERGHREHSIPDQERILLEGKESSDDMESDTIDCLKFHGSAPGALLLEWGMTKKQVPDEEKEYDIVAWKIGPHLIKATINQDPLGARPYYTAGFREVPDAFWHVGVPELAESAQKLANAVFRSVAVNVALASGPQIEVDVDRLAPGEAFRMWPYRVWKATNQQLREGQAVNFYQPQIVTGPLMDVYEFCLRMADEDTGVPRYSHGEPANTPETASALSMLMSQSAKGIKMVVKNIDDGVVAESVEYAYNYITQYEDDIEVIGDLRAMATGSYALMAREQQAMRRTEFLAQTANQFDMEVIGRQGRGELLKQALKALDIDPEKIILTEEIPAQPPSAPPGGVAGMVGAGLPTPDGLTPGAPPPAPAALNEAGAPVAGRDTQLFESGSGLTP